MAKNKYLCAIKKNDVMTMELKYDSQGDAPKRLLLETYGCQMNVADSEVVATVMMMAGYETCETIDEADAIFINTCSVRDNAEQRIFSRLNQLNALRHKRQRRLIIGIIGCMAERLKEVLISEHDVDVVAGPDAYLELPALIALAEGGEKAINTELSTTETYRDIIPSRVGGSKVSGFISIMRGCNNFCTYCIVPYTRGRERSREPQSILNELADLRQRGFKEVTLLGQNVNSYLYKPADGSAPVDLAALLASVVVQADMDPLGAGGLIPFQKDLIEPCAGFLEPFHDEITEAVEGTVHLEVGCISNLVDGCCGASDGLIQLRAPISG